jgi:hypothetical protein
MIALQLAAGVLWTLAYALIIRRAALDRAPGMPMTAMCINIAWETYYSFVSPHPPPQRYVDWAWLLLDVVIVAQFLRYGRGEHERALPRWTFLPVLGFTLAMAFWGVAAAEHDLHDRDGMYSAFGDDMLMSLLFLRMLFRRRDVRGQSLYIALAKLVGSACVCVVGYHEHPERQLLCVFYAGLLVFDVAYALLLARRSRQLGLNPWRRM